MVYNARMTNFVPQKRNANKHTSYGLRLLEKSVQGDGWLDAQTAAADGEIISGSARIELAAEKFADVEPIIVHSDGSRPVIVIRDDIPNAEHPRARRLSVAANKIAQVDFDPDWALLAEWGGEDEQIKKLFSDDEWREGTGEEKPQVDAPAEIARAAELAEKWQTKSGQLWKLGEHRLLIGDCTVQENVERLMGGEMAQMCFTSPPYAEQRKEQYGGTEPNKYWDWWKPIQENAKSILLGNGSFFVNIKAHRENGSRNLYVMDLVCNMVRLCGWRFIDELCWNKNGLPGDFVETFRNDFEPVYHFSPSEERVKFRVENVLKGGSTSIDFIVGSLADRQGTGKYETRKRELSGIRPSNVLKIGVDTTVEGHAAAFPIALPTFFILAYSDKDDVIYEPFGGSGTTIIAANNLKRRCFAMEISEKYGAVVLERFYTATGIMPELVD